MPYFSFIMVCYNNWSFTSHAIESFFDSLNPLFKWKGIEFTIINNGSSDETSDGIEEYKRKYKGVTEIITIHLEQNLGYIIGVNIGLLSCSGEIITILNNDLIFCQGWMDGLVNILENDESVGVAVPLLTNGSGQENIVLKFKFPELEHSFYKSKATMDYYAQKIMEKNREVVIYSSRVVGACVALKSKVLNLVGGLDFWYGIGIFDDDDFSLRTNIAGFKTAIVGSSFVYHVGNATFSKVRTVSNAAVISNKMKFIHKWKLRCLENIEGKYNSREEIITNTSYSREKHYAPLTLEQFNPYSKAKTNKNSETRNVLMVADWMNFKSEWLQKLETLKPQLGENKEIQLWMPGWYFSQKEINDVASRIVEISKSKDKEERFAIKLNNVDVNAIDLLKFISSFDEVLLVENDFVNQYIVYLARQITVAVS